MVRDWMSTFRGAETANPYGAVALGSDLLSDRVAGRPDRTGQGPATRSASRPAEARERPEPKRPAQRSV